MTTRVYTAREVADLLRLRSTYRIDQGVRRGELPHLRIGRAIRFTEEHVREIERAFERRPEVGAQAGPGPEPVAAAAAEVFALSRRSRRRAAR